MIGTSRASKQATSRPELRDLDGDGKRFAIAIDGRITFAGPREECERRLRLMMRPATRALQDHSLARAIGRA